jgi:proline iminopeptidase
LRRFFNPSLYHVVLFDQRGCGKSTPHASIEQNTTWDLVEDIEKIRVHLGFQKWQVFGGSWGSTLALAYSQTHPDRVTEIVLRGIFLLRDKEIQWFYQAGANELYPDYWEEYFEYIPANERADLVSAYHRRLTHTDKKIQVEAAKIWSAWEASASRLYPDAAMIESFREEKFALAFARIECHYFMNKGFMEPNQLLNNVEKIRHIPSVIVQGRYDVICPMESAWALHKAWPESDLFLIPDGGHSAFEIGLSKALVSATDRFSSNQ